MDPLSVLDTDNPPHRYVPVENWHLDKRVPIALIITLIIQTGVIIWWAAGVSYRLDTLERTQQSSSSNSDRITRLEVKLESINDGISRIERLIQQKQ